MGDDVDQITVLLYTPKCFVSIKRFFFSDHLVLICVIIVKCWRSTSIFIYNNHTYQNQTCSYAYWCHGGCDSPNCRNQRTQRPPRLWPLTLRCDLDIDLTSRSRNTAIGCCLLYFTLVPGMIRTFAHFYDLWNSPVTFSFSFCQCHYHSKY